MSGKPHRCGLMCSLGGFRATYLWLRLRQMTNSGSVSLFYNGTLRLAAAATFILVMAGVGLTGSAQAKLPPLRDPVFLNIGFV